MKPVTLYVIIRKEHQDRHGVALSLQQACARLGVEYKELIAEEISLDTIANMQFEAHSLLYRIGTNIKVKILEVMLVTLHPGTFTTIYAPKEIVVPTAPYRELCEQMAAGITIIPTLIIDETWAQLDDTALAARVDTLGGLPLVVKTLGLSHGEGVRKVASLTELRSLVATIPSEQYGAIARKYLADYRHYRVIVIAGKGVAAIEYHKPADDFRTNASKEPIVSAVNIEDLPPKVVDLAVQGTELRSSLLGGADILVDQTDGTAYLAEVNVPCFYVRAEGPTGIDISAHLVQALLDKREKEVA